MALRLDDIVKATVEVGGETAIFTLRRPTNEEMNRFLATRFDLKGKRGKVEDQGNFRRCQLFDKLLVEVNNLEDAQGAPVTPERKDLIPANWKVNIIFQTFEEAEIEIKN